MTFKTAIEHSRRSYAAHLRLCLQRQLPPATRSAAQAALDTTEAGLLHREALTHAQVSLTLGLVENALAQDVGSIEVLI